MIRRQLVMVLAPILLAACMAAPPTIVAPPTLPPPSPPAARLNNTGIAAVLVAGDASQPVFDNSVNSLRDLLRVAGEPASRQTLLTAMPHHSPQLRTATVENTLAAIANMDPPAWGSCLVFLSSHGAPGEGLYLSRSQAALNPTALDRALQQGCGNVPTVLIVSGCYSGMYDEAPLARANRIILTATTRDRPSFGCGAGFTYTYFDDCLLGSLQGTADWTEIYRRTRGCVGIRERQSGVRRSYPQAYFGDAAARIEAPWRPIAPDDPEAIRFQPSGSSFSPHSVPLSPEAKQLMDRQLAFYRAAPSPKALALAPLGFVVVVAQDASGRRSDGDVARLALQRCEYLTGGGCILYARNEATISLPGAGALPLYHPPLLRRTGMLRPDEVPFLREDQQAEIQQYMALPPPKALALSPSRTFFSIGHGASIAAARLDALMRCQQVLDDCIVYAENDRIILGW